MRIRAQLRQGALKMPWTHGALFRLARASRQGFTLLEMCIVLLIIALTVGAMMPAIDSAFIEQAIRGDGHQLSLMVKTAMLQSSEQHRPYVLDLTATTASLHPLAEEPVDADSSSSTKDDADSDQNAGPENVKMARKFSSPIQLVVPDPVKANTWDAMPPTSLVFQPGDLCPAPRLRLARGEAWLELNFNPLTGNVENEAAYFP